MAKKTIPLTDTIFESICETIESSKDGLHPICKKFKVSYTEFRKKIRNDEEKRNRYVRAKEDQADYLADLIIDVAFDDSDDEKAFVGVNHIQRDKLKVDSLKFIAAKLKPTKYGDKIEVTGKQEVTINWKTEKPKE